MSGRLKSADAGGDGGRKTLRIRCSEGTTADKCAGKLGAVRRYRGLGSEEKV